jgi:hypothetical protein
MEPEVQTVRGNPHIALSRIFWDVEGIKELGNCSGYKNAN